MDKRFQIQEADFFLGDIQLECGQILQNASVRYTVLGNISDYPDRVVWICHALTANSNPAQWWPGMVGRGKLIDPEHTPVVCANVLGSCYGSTGPTSTNPLTGKPYLTDFPIVTVRDVVKAHDRLREFLGIDSVWFALGGSIGGFQVLEWAIAYPDSIRHLGLIATAAQASPWVRAFSQSQRLALTADPSFYRGGVDGGKTGLTAARSIALLSYRGPSSYNRTQQDANSTLLQGYRATTYQTYQGEKLAARFNAHSYYALSLLLDSHDIARARTGAEKVLKSLTNPTLVVGIDTDILFPTREQRFIADWMPNAIYREIHSDFCHDGFLLEYEQLSSVIRDYFRNFNVEF